MHSIDVLRGMKLSQVIFSHIVEYAVWVCPCHVPDIAQLHVGSGFFSISASTELD